MKFIADLHIHSPYSRATSRAMTLDNLHRWAQLKGISLIATGDFTHPTWFAHLTEKLEPAEDGVFRLKDNFRMHESTVPRSCRRTVRFILTAEISCIYKKNGRTRKVHNLVLVPDINTAAKINNMLNAIGNIRSDGRPILGLDSKDLLTICLEASPRTLFIPAHAWTPHFSVLGSQSGFDSVEECFEDLTGHIYALETGLSSDPGMNWQVSELDRFTLISNSDAHSPEKLGREANVFNTDLSYEGLRTAIMKKDPSTFLKTIEFFPEHGKYHMDGHRNCKVMLHPGETKQLGSICPVCSKKVTVGVLNRVRCLADRKEGFQPSNSIPYTCLIPLKELLSEIHNVGASSKTVDRHYMQLLDTLGDELSILDSLPIENIQKAGYSDLAHSITLMRKGQVHKQPGYDGEYGIMTIGEKKKDILQENDQQLSLFVSDEPASVHNGDSSPLLADLTQKQREAVTIGQRPIIVAAGAGTGKTRVLTHRIAYWISHKQIDPNHILAITFTQKAAHEVKKRLQALLGQETCNRLFIGTIHQAALYLLKNMLRQEDLQILDREDQILLVKKLMKNHAEGRPERLPSSRRMINCISRAKGSPEGTPPSDIDHTWFLSLLEAYNSHLQERQLLDFDDIVNQAVTSLRSDQRHLGICQKRFSFILVDEYQDINDAQYAFITLLSRQHHNLFAIGDADQAIYGFRSANIKNFLSFEHDFPGAITISLEQNFRSTDHILACTNTLIGHNSERIEKTLVGSGIIGPKVLVCETSDERMEAQYIIRRIESSIGGSNFTLVDSGSYEANENQDYGHDFNDFVVLYRNNAQSKAIEEAFLKAGIPYHVVKGRRFCEWPEIRDVMAYLSLLANPTDDDSLIRVINTPKRGIGESTITCLQAHARNQDAPLIDLLERPEVIGSFAQKQRTSIRHYLTMLRELHSLAEDAPLQSIIRDLLQKTGLQSYHGTTSHQDHNRLEELIGRAHGYDEKRGIPSIQQFLHDLRFWDYDTQLEARVNKVFLMSIHASKGLEFPVVFITGLEDGLFPSSRINQDPTKHMEEERRLCYVGLTRAQRELHLLHAKERFFLGSRYQNMPSPFLDELPEEHIERVIYHRNKSKRKSDDQQLSLW